MINTSIWFYTVVAGFIIGIGLYKEMQSPLSDYRTTILFGVMWPVMTIIALGFFIDKRVSS